MSSALEHYLSIFFGLGLVVVAAYAWQRFNEPSFPSKSTLPRTLDPLRYLFLGPEYKRARFTYVAASVLLYGVLVWPGPSIIPMLAAVGVKEFPPEGWALIVALILVGVIPNVKWITFIEESLRRWVHGWFLVPNGVMQTIGIMEDADYYPPPRHLDAVGDQLREQLKGDLKFARNTLGYRWGRARMLIQVLNQIRAGATHLLRSSDFQPFEEDFDEIYAKYKALSQDVPSTSSFLTDDQEAVLTKSIDALLRQIYAYLSWGVRYRAESEEAVERTLRDLGFRVPNVKRRPLSDILIPTVLLVAMITVGFWLTYDVMARALGADTPKMSDSVVNALSSAMAAVLMYGYSVYVALNERNLQIEQKVWEQGSPRCNIRIATKAGLLTWTVIVITTVIWQWPQTLEAIRELAYWVKGLLGQAQDSSRVPSFPLFLPSKIATAFPWFLAGATVSVVLSNRMAGDVRRTRTKDRLGDALVMGASLAVAVAAAQLIQMSMTDTIFHQTVSSFGLVPIIGLAGFACGATIGYFVPQRAKINLVTPSNSVNAIALEELLRHARKVFETDEAATNWIYNPRAEFGGITPAEAIGHKGLATGVRELLNDLATSQTDAGRSGKDVRLRPMLIQSG